MYEAGILVLRQPQERRVASPVLGRAEVEQPAPTTVALAELVEALDPQLAVGIPEGRRDFVQGLVDVGEPGMRALVPVDEVLIQAEGGIDRMTSSDQQLMEQHRV